MNTLLCRKKYSKCNATVFSKFYFWSNKKKTTELQVKFEFFKTHIHQNSVGLFISSSIIKIRYKNLL